MLGTLAGLFLAIRRGLETAGDTTHKDKWEGGIDGEIKSKKRFTTGCDTIWGWQPTKEKIGARDRVLWLGWRLYQCVTGGMCLFYSECVASSHGMRALLAKDRSSRMVRHLSPIVSKWMEKSFMLYCTQNTPCFHDNTQPLCYLTLGKMSKSSLVN